ncbi:hypothetical protein M501DRAFT_993823 [Patellaria atrata CBS 101060]|uniref:Secreted protein n=1 Tax=Patellaria atrata CBS 101060 TaxID=1346257 RepID=A0A9P4SJL7_9PEZI|nr:hypothetical protein M501DRAFT_993823 [Patellaria atrata CBS 101060]
MLILGGVLVLHKLSVCEGGLLQFEKLENSLFVPDGNIRGTRFCERHHPPYNPPSHTHFSERVGRVISRAIDG